MAHKKGVGSSKNGRESHSKRLGIKKFGGEAVIPGNIIVRQRGTRYHAGVGVEVGRDHTLYATIPGNVLFTTKKDERKVVHVVPPAAPVEA